MTQETRQLIGPFPSKMQNTCTHCQFKVHRFSPIFFYKQRRTQAEIASGVQVKSAIVLHQTCADSWLAKQSNDVKWELKTPSPQEAMSQDDESSTPVAETPVATLPSGTVGQSTDLLSLIASSVLPLVQSQLSMKLDEVQVKAIAQGLIDKAMKAVEFPVHRVEVFNPTTQETKDMGVQHKQFPKLLKMVSARMHNGCRLNIWVAGSAGTGKTSAAQYCAEALGLDFASTGSVSEEYKVLGFVSPATGQAVLTAFLDKWENGGVFVFDDFDGSDPIAALGLNTPLAGNYCTFPDGRVVKRHVDCVLILTANTWGHGATTEYVGRLKQDAAFLDRFVKLNWEIDEELELATSGNAEWCRRVQMVRKQVAAKGLKVLVTPRATYYGTALLEAGMTWAEVEAATLSSAMTKDQWQSVRGN